MSLDIDALRAQFPILTKKVNGKTLTYLDNAATTQKPQVVIDALVDFYTQCNSNVHRGAHALSGTTEAINIIANGLAQKLNAGDEVVITEMEHHANLVTWQQACLKAGATLQVAQINELGELDIADFTAKLNSNTRLVAFPHASNALGTLNPISELTSLVKNKSDALVLIDGAQGIAHCPVDVQAIGCDFYVFSGHKLFAPTGVGVLWGRFNVLENWPVWQTGGEMIRTVDYQESTWGVLPHRLEAGTPNIAGAIGMGAAVEWFMQQDFDALRQHEANLLNYAINKAKDFPGIELIGTAKDKVGVMSFLVEGTHPGDLGFILDQQGVAIRTGDHCAQPLMKRLGLGGTARASFSIYNTIEEIDTLFVALTKAKNMLA